MAILLFPFKDLARYMENNTSKLGFTGNSKTEEIMKHVSWSVGAASKYTPWQSKCFAQALAAQMMLRRRRIASTVYFGVARENADALAAHAWLKCGDMIVTGEKNRDKFSPVVRIGY